MFFKEIIFFQILKKKNSGESLSMHDLVIFFIKKNDFF